MPKANSEAKKVMNGRFRDWLADMCDSFSQSLKDEQDPEVTFVANGATFQIRLIDAPGQYTREEFPVDVIMDGRS